MEVKQVNINPASFLPKKKSKKRVLSENDSMQVDEITGIEGRSKDAVPRAKRSKNVVESRKIAVPTHRYFI